jgi:hypothetical protein
VQLVGRCAGDRSKLGAKRGKHQRRGDQSEKGHDHYQLSSGEEMGRFPQL